MKKMNREIQSLENFANYVVGTMKPENRDAFSEAIKSVYHIDHELSPVTELHEIPHALAYESNNLVFKPNLHSGQRKLFLGSLQFLTNVLARNEAAYVVYAGAACGRHIGLLSRLFPHLRWLLVDPNKFAVDGQDWSRRVGDYSNPCHLYGQNADDLVGQFLRSKHRMCIVRDLFTMELAHALYSSLRGNYLFISDIRTNSKETDGEEPDSLDVLWNMAQQFLWMRIMKPKWSVVKFRFPFYIDSEKFMSCCEQEPYKSTFQQAREHYMGMPGIDFVADFHAKCIVYFDGHVNIQAFAGRSSTESRLVTNCTKLHAYGNVADYENKYYFYNEIMRWISPYKNDNASRAHGFDQCADCSLENLIWSNYISTHGNGENVIDMVCELNATIYDHKMGLLKDGHGYMFGKRCLSKLKHAFFDYRQRLGAREKRIFATINAAKLLK